MSPRTEISTGIQPLDTRAVSYIADAYAGRQRRLDLRSGLPRRTDILRVRRHVSKVPSPEVADVAGQNKSRRKATPIQWGVNQGGEAEAHFASGDTPRRQRQQSRSAALPP